MGPGLGSAFGPAPSCEIESGLKGRGQGKLFILATGFPGISDCFWKIGLGRGCAQKLFNGLVAVFKSLHAAALLFLKAGKGWLAKSLSLAVPSMPFRTPFIMMSS